MKAKHITTLNIKTALLVLILFCIGTTTIVAQEEAEVLQGKVKYEDSYLQDINIINLRSNLGTSSNSHGIFIIPAVEGDSILFSSISYQNRIIVVTDHHIQDHLMTVYLEPGFNELDEVEILRKVRLEFNNVAVDQRAVLDADEISVNSAPNVQQTFDYNTQLTNGVSLTSIYKAITQKARAKKQSENDEKNQITHLQNEFPNKIKAEYGDEFFTEWLYIPADEINLFLDFCQENGLGELYDSNEFIVKNFLVLESNEYLKLKK